MTLQELCFALHLPQEVTGRVLAQERPEDASWQALVAQLPYRDRWESMIHQMKEYLGDDPDGMKMLAAQLYLALDTAECYRREGIEEWVFLDTMGFCNRFVREHYAMYGCYAYTWGWWFPRQLSMQEFRIGALEYELVTEEPQKILIHIPADADLSQESLADSYRDAKAFLRRHRPDWAEAPIYCDSWMLSPALPKLLSEDSRILQFQQSFAVEMVREGSCSFLRWVYQIEGEQADYTTLQENTSLQRAMKAYVLQGGKVEDGYGRLVPCPFGITEA